MPHKMGKKMPTKQPRDPRPRRQKKKKKWKSNKQIYVRKGMGRLVFFFLLLLLLLFFERRVDSHWMQLFFSFLFFPQIKDIKFW